MQFMAVIFFLQITCEFFCSLYVFVATEIRYNVIVTCCFYVVFVLLFSEFLKFFLPLFNVMVFILIINKASHQGRYIVIKVSFCKLQLHFYFSKCQKK